MTLISPADEIIIGLCVYGKAEALDKSIFKPEWLEGEVARKAVTAAISLTREGKKVDAFAVISRARFSEPKAASEIMRIFKNGHGQASLDDAIKHIYQEYTLREARKVASEISLLANTKPDEVEKWLPQKTTGLVQLLRDGEVYDPSPLAHDKKKLPVVFAESLIPGMTDILRGGYRSGHFVCYAGVTSHGKTVTLNSHVLDLALQGYKVTVIRTENTPQDATAQLVAALGGFDLEKEVRPKKFVGNQWETSEERAARYRQQLQWLAEYVEIYDAPWCNDERLKRIARWSRPQAIVLDMLKKQPGLFSRKNFSQDEVGDFADWLLNFAKDEGICFLTAGQMSDGAGKGFVKTSTTEGVILFGTVRVEQACDLFAGLKRDKQAKNTAYFRVKKDRLGGRLDTEHRIELDPQRGILRIPRLLNQQLTTP